MFTPNVYSIHAIAMNYAVWIKHHSPVGVVKGNIYILRQLRELKIDALNGTMNVKN